MALTPPPFPVDPNTIPNTTNADRMRYADWATRTVREIELRLQQEGRNLQPGQFIEPTPEEREYLSKILGPAQAEDFAYGNMGGLTPTPSNVSKKAIQAFDPSRLAYQQQLAGATTQGGQAQFLSPEAMAKGEENPAFAGATKAVKDAMDKLYDAGYTINPNANITEKSLDEFLAIAGKEIDPYYATQLKLASDSLKKSLGYSEQQLLQAEGDLEKKYGRSLRDLGETSAESGFALSGRRKEEEKELASETQKAIETGRRALGFQAGQQVGTFAQQYGGMQGFNLPGRSLPGAPTVSAGEAGFKRPGQSNYYELSPEVYNSLVGSEEFARRGAISTRASELEGAKNLSESLTRTLNI